MNIETGHIIELEKLQTLPASERAKYVEVKRDLTAAEAFNKQIDMYSLCGCGSGRKFKFCCHLKRP